MARKFTALLGALIIAATALLPSVAAAEPRHRRGDYGYYNDHNRGYYDRRGRHYRDHDDDDDDALAAGVIGLVLGAVIGSAVTQSNNDRRARDGYYAPPPPPPRYNSGGYYDGPPQGYYEPRLCVQRQETWDPYARRYVTLERRVPC